ncbi:peptidoglycan hydrolase-like protein with peptidoglycan-binding domain [Alkalibacillus flavidus]|uniref:Autolysin n=1 Tax=Alkalibacillus flavidus TaxID=546021 RepID=A0ABV2KUP4_9BACI
MQIEDVRGQTMGGDSTRRTVNRIVRHHSATETGDVWTFEQYWQSKGWETGGYHEIILRDGTIQRCYDWDVVTNGVKGYNATSYHICLVGRGSFTDEQERVFQKRIETWLNEFQLGVQDVIGHRELAAGTTQCPGIDMDVVRARINDGSGDPSLIQRGDRGKDVEQLQRTLISKGYDLPQYGADGVFGSETEQAVKSLQQDAGITVDGIVGPETRRAMDREMTLPTGIYRKGSRGQAVQHIQRALERIGFSPGPVDGIYGPKTEAAIKQFQKEHVPNEVDGTYGPNTRSAMASALA